MKTWTKALLIVVAGALLFAGALVGGILASTNNAKAVDACALPIDTMEKLRACFQVWSEEQKAIQPAETEAPDVDGASPDYGLPPQPYVPHPSSYQESGVVGEPKTWTINVLEGTTLVYGGFTVNDETDGVYGAVAGPSTVILTVIDGFYSVVKNEWAEQEYCFRVGEAEKYGWAMTNLHPLDGWTCSD